MDMIRDVMMSYDDRLSIYYSVTFSDVAQTYCCIAHRLIHLLLLYTTETLTSSVIVQSNKSLHVDKVDYATSSTGGGIDYVMYLQWIQSMRNPRDVVTFLLYNPDLTAISTVQSYRRWLSLLYVNITDVYRRSLSDRIDDILCTGVSRFKVHMCVPDTILGRTLDVDILSRLLEVLREDMYNSSLPIELYNHDARIIWLLQGEHHIDIDLMLNSGAKEVRRPLFIYDDIAQYVPKSSDGKHILIKLREKSATTIYVRYLRQLITIDVADYNFNGTLYVELHRAAIETSNKGSVFLLLSNNESAVEPNPRFIYKAILSVLCKS